MVFTTEAEKVAGLGRFRKVPKDIIFVFPFTGHPNRIHTHSMRETIWVYELDRNCKLVDATLMKPLRVLALHPNTQHVVETAKTTPRPKDFKFVKEYVR